MEQIRTEAVGAFNMLSTAQKKLIGSDAVAVLRTAIGYKTKDGLTDGAVDKALEHHRLSTWGYRTQSAYRQYLLYHFLFGSEARRKSAERRRMEKKSHA
jgi:hypothetical protein